MEVLYYLAGICLLLFAILATYDGIYLHLWKFELFRRNESKQEHLTHTIRALLFPIILYLLFVQGSSWSFWMGLFFVGVDLLVLAWDAYVEKDSRAFMNGLPRWEYIIHLFANGLHFASIVLMIAANISLNGVELVFLKEPVAGLSYDFLQIVVVNLLPGSILLAAGHVFLSFKAGVRFWEKHRMSWSCC